MENQDIHEKNQKDALRQRVRSSGRVGRQWGAAKVKRDSDQKPSNPNEILTIYQRLFDLRDHDANELMGAISYGFKLLGHGKNFDQKKK